MLLDPAYAMNSPPSWNKFITQPWIPILFYVLLFTSFAYFPTTYVYKSELIIYVYS